MPVLILQNLHNRAIGVSGEDYSILQRIQTEGIDWMHACGAKGRCTTCKMIVVEGMAHLSELTKAELNYRNAGRLRDNERLTCQTRLLTGEVTARVPEAYQLPHMHYSE